MSKEAWAISTVSMLNALQKKACVAGVMVDDLKYTVLDDRNVVYRGAQELAELHSINEKIAPKDCVAYRPERIALHETIMAVSTQLKIKNEEQMQGVVKLIHSEVIAEVKGLGLEDMRNKIKADVTSKVDQYLTGTLDDEKIKAICKEVSASGVKFGKFKDGYTDRDAMIARATDSVFADQANQMIAPLVSKKIAGHQELHALDIPPNSERLMLMVSGGQASGKGSSVSRLQKDAAEAKVDWDNMVKINTDSYKSLLLEPGTVKPELYSQLAQEEASTVNQGIQKRLTAMAKEGKAPHIFIDQVFVGPAQIELGLEKGGKVRGIIVSTDVNDAVERSYGRGQAEGDKGRYENTQGVLRCHKLMAEQVPDTLSKYVGQDVQFLLVDNNVAKGEQATNVMEIDLKRAETIVYSKDNLDRFAMKSHINIDAKAKGELYVKPEPPPIEDYLKPLVNKGMNFTGIALDSLDPDVIATVGVSISSR